HGTGVGAGLRDLGRCVTGVTTPAGPRKFRPRRPRCPEESTTAACGAHTTRRDDLSEASDVEARRGSSTPRSQCGGGSPGGAAGNERAGDRAGVAGGPGPCTAGHSGPAGVPELRLAGAVCDPATGGAGAEGSGAGVPAAGRVTKW